ncbi:MAG: hypothetical protein NTY12_02435 [Candidatus Falkowbacteria bacterium]|nr:hypothetical protein [Candidatus Falkowbacteria bacterium]
MFKEGISSELKEPIDKFVSKDGYYLAYLDGQINLANINKDNVEKLSYDDIGLNRANNYSWDEIEKAFAESYGESEEYEKWKNN